MVSGLNSQMLELLIDLAYHAPIHEQVGLHNVREVLDVAEAPGNMAEIRNHCLRVLEENSELENYVGTYQLALRTGYWHLSSDALHCIVRNFDKVWTTSPQFQSLKPDEFRCVLLSDELHAPNEVDFTFGGILKWIAGNVEERRSHLPRLLPLIRFAFSSTADMANVDVETDPLVRSSEEALGVLTVIKRTLIQEPMDDVDGWIGQEFSQWRWFKPRVPKDILFGFGGWTGGVTNHILTYNCRSSRWLLQPHQNTVPRAYHGAAMLGKLVYFVAGFDGQECYQQS